MSKPFQKVLLVELNEFNLELLEKASSQLKLSHIQKLLSFQRSKTVTADTYESDFLEPWVQWVSVHTGVPSTVHQIKHLGDVPHLGTKQLWEELSEKGVSSGIWGAMNASRATAHLCRFFCPDPWTASESAYPNELNQLLTPLRYASKNYLNKDPKILTRTFFGLIKHLYSNHLLTKTFKEIPHLIANLAKFHGQHFVFISLFDYLSTLLFLEYKKRFQPDFSLLFINSLAHLQHHHWKDHDYKNNLRLCYGLSYLNRTLRAIFSSLAPNELLLTTNALSQKNTKEEKAWILYRQKDQSSFLKAIGIRFSKIEPHMTHDAHIFFNSIQECLNAKNILSQAKIGSENLFLVETYPQDPQKLFYRICFTDEIPKESVFHIGQKVFPFFELFKPIVQRTGKHIPEGTLLWSGGSFPQIMNNHEIYHHILKLFKN